MPGSARSAGYLDRVTKCRRRPQPPTIGVMARDLIAALRSRVAAYHQGDPSAVLADRALAEAGELLRRSTTDDGGVPLGVAEVVAWVRYMRSAELPADQRRAELQAALELFGAIAQVDRSLVPADILRCLDAGAGADDPPPAEPGFAVGLANDSVALRMRYRRTGNPGTLNVAVQLGRHAVAAASGDDEARGALIALANALGQSYELTSDERHLDEAVDSAERAIRIAPGDAVALVTLGGLLSHRFGRADLQRAAQLLRRAVEVTPAEDARRPLYLANLAGVFGRTYGITGDLEDLDGAVAAGRSAGEALHPGMPSAAAILTNLSGALHTRFERTGDVRDFDEAIVAVRRALAAGGLDQAVQTGPLNNLSVVLLARFEATGDPRDLDEAIDAGRRVLALARADHANRPMYLANLGGLLGKRFERSAAPGDLEERIRHTLEAIARTSPADPKHAAFLGNLSDALYQRFRHAGDIADLDEAVEVARQAIRATPDLSPDHPRRLSALGDALESRYGATGNSADLDEAIEVIRLAVETLPAGHTLRAGYLSDLNGLLQTRYERNGSGADVDQAVTLGRRALEAYPAGHPQRPKTAAALGNILRARYEHGRSVADLEESVRLAREAVTEIPAGVPGRSYCLGVLALTLRIRFERGGDMADLDAAIDATTAGLAGETGLGRVSFLANLGALQLLRYRWTGDRAALDTAVAVLRQATAATVSSRVADGAIRSNLGAALAARFDLSGDPADLEDASAALRTATEAITAPAAVRVGAAARLAHLTAETEGPAAALPQYTAVAELLPLLSWRGIGVGDRHRLLAADAVDIGVDAAASAVDGASGGCAVELLEQARGVVWAQLLDQRIDPTALRLQHRNLAGTLDRCRAALDEPYEKPSAEGWW
jgi:tetratricopeptide (TPR) repeat protein